MGVNPLLLAGIVFELAFTAVLIWVPPFQSVFGTAPLPWDVVALLLTFPVLLWGADELRRSRRRRRTAVRGRAAGTARRG
ncbi:cation transporting ATPase C-terminal domain-containing protein [Streptomyces sp. WMMB303]|nr:cation transporting ATPase C-terminal domain-containing protein [Streptomyces sp. WMMB303]MDF4252177.1 cation transporting ATPase C-terminal domain-containing protein [Streptomyces sp. WMMB303]